MIERMKKITIVCLDDDQERSLQSLRNLASVHVSSHAPQVSVETATISASLSDVSQLLYFLESLDVKGALSTSAPEIDGEEATSRALRILGGYRKRQGELQEMMEKNIAFKNDALQLLKQAETDAYAPVKKKLNEAVANVARERGYAFVINTDNDACPYVNPEMGEDATEAVKAAIK